MLARRRRRLLLSVSALAALALPAPAWACDDTVATAVPDSATVAVAQTTTLCLVNAERTKRGLHALVVRKELTSASIGLAHEMVERTFFDHIDPDGATMRDRLQQAGWIPSTGSWSAGENIAWASGSHATPGQTVAAWMASPGHRANILQPAFREAGIGITLGAPVAGVTLPAATFVTDFGVRSTPARGTTAGHIRHAPVTRAHQRRGQRS